MWKRYYYLVVFLFVDTRHFFMSKTNIRGHTKQANSWTSDLKAHRKHCHSSNIYYTIQLLSTSRPRVSQVTLILCVLQRLPGLHTRICSVSNCWSGFHNNATLQSQVSSYFGKLVQFSPIQSSQNWSAFPSQVGIRNWNGCLQEYSGPEVCYNWVRTD